jgi:hypothetical protein
MKVNVTARRARPKTPPGDAVTEVTHTHIRQGVGYSKADGVGPGDVDSGSLKSRSRGPNAEDRGVFEASKRQDTEGSIGGEVAAGELGYYDTARAKLRSMGIAYLPPRVGGTSETDALVRALYVALKEAAAANRRKNQTPDDLKGWKAGQNLKALRGWAATDLSLGDDPDRAARRARRAAAEQLSSLDLTPDPCPDRRRTLSLPGGGSVTKKRAEAAWREQLANSNIPVE